MVTSPSSDFTAVVLSYGRPQNISLLLESLLRTPEVARIIVSNNNPDLPLSRWIGRLPDRVTLIEQHIRRMPDFRMELARREGSPHILCCDDDMFLLPSQLSVLCQGLLADPSVPHGYTGQIYDPWLDQMHYGVTEHPRRLDVVSRVTAFTQEHVRTYFELRSVLGSVPSSADDIVLSFSGNGQPQSHVIGSVMTCPTSDDPRLCLWKQEGFFPSRMKLFLLLRRLRRLS